jgi:uncharacterized protein (DUF1697 family)
MSDPLACVKLRRMGTWVALLRAVNLGGHNKVPMARLRTAMTDAGYDNVRTVIASGNVVFERPRSSAAELERLVLEEFKVETIVLQRTAAQIRALAKADPFGGDNAYVAFLAKKPSAAALRSLAHLDEHALVGSDLVLHFPRGYSNAQLTGAVIEKKLGCAATVRNWRTVEKLAALVG